MYWKGYSNAEKEGIMLFGFIIPKKKLVAVALI